MELMKVSRKGKGREANEFIKEMKGVHEGTRAALEKAAHGMK